MPQRQPVLLASNHSGSFFDAVVIGAVVSQPIYTLARGDVFRKPRAAYWLRAINLIPVFRGSEGRENLKKIDATVEECFSVMKRNGTVIIFSEGICVNEWNLRPLGKGTARMAYQAWYGDDTALHTMAVVPTGITYEHFRGAGKRVILHFGEKIGPGHIRTDPADYEKWLREFNALLTERMGGAILQISKDDSPQEASRQLEGYLAACPRPAGNAILNFLGTLGRALNQPIYRFYTKWVAQKTKGTVFYDSVLFGLLMYTYPILIGLLALVVGAFTTWQIGLAVFIGFPIAAWIGNRYRA